ncbi:TPA: AraC family ligand binding domain-containing protein, partial [Klebsiella pneumoniae]|nr:AraC family ligand binding domain-containing protein [Klebsiella pneumoniae]
MRNVKIDEFDRLDRDVVALGNDYVQGFILPPHQHRRAQLLYGATGLMYVTTQGGEWVVPPQHAVWIPPETVHAVRFAGVTTRSLYIEPDCVAAFIKHRRCEVISVSPLLRQLLLEAVDLPPLYDSPRDRTLIQLMLLELAAMPVREFDIPLPQHPALLALCQAFLLNPSIHDPAARWARALFM